MMINTVSSLLVVGFACFGFASSSFAVGNVSCSSADQRVTFANSYPDGGAAFPETYEITLDGQVVYRENEFGGEEPVNEVNYRTDERTEIAFTPMHKNQPQVVEYVERITLTKVGTGEKVYQGFLLCRDVSRPCHLCP